MGLHRGGMYDRVVCIDADACKQHCNTCTLATLATQAEIVNGRIAMLAITAATALAVDPSLKVISPHLRTPPHTSPHLRTPPRISPYLPVSPHISPYLPPLQMLVSMYRTAKDAMPEI